MMHLLASDYSIILLIKGGNLSGTDSYQALVQSTFGYPGFLVLSALQFLYPFIGGSFIFDWARARMLWQHMCRVFTICSGAFVPIKLEVNNGFLSFPSDDQLQHHNWWHADQSVPENPRRCSMEHALRLRYRNTLNTREKMLEPSCHSGSRTHPRRAPLCDLTVDGGVHVAPVSLQEHREAREGQSACFPAATFSACGAFLAACEPSVRVSRCPCCRWCWPWPSSSPWSSELPR